MAEDTFIGYSNTGKVWGQSGTAPNARLTFDGTIYSITGIGCQEIGGVPTALYIEFDKEPVGVREIMFSGETVPTDDPLWVPTPMLTFFAEGGTWDARQSAMVYLNHGYDIKPYLSESVDIVVQLSK